MLKHTLELPVKWTKTGDPIPHRRGETLSLKIPASDGYGPASPLLGLIQSQRDPILLPGERETLDADGVAEAVAMANATLETKREKERTERLDALRRYANGDGEVHIHWPSGREPAELPKADAELLSGDHAVLDTVRCILSTKAEEREERERVRRADEDRRQEGHRQKIKADRQSADVRKAEKLAWIEEHGSERLRTQIDLEYNGWPLYLHERLEADLPGAELHEDADDWDMVSNPTEEQLGAERVVLDALANLDGYGTSETCWRWEAAEDDGWDEGTANRTPRLVVEGYRPGNPAHAWKRYVVVFR